MKSLKDCFKLSNGVEIPCVGFGTFQTPDGGECISAVKSALDVGYRHIDTAYAYGNEKGVGTAIKQSGIPRSELFITTKLWNKTRGYDETISVFDESLENLQLDYVDLYLVHWPNPIDYRDNWQEANASTWRAMETLYNEKRIRAIGISNFHPHHMDELMKTAEVVPMVNQIRLCPGDTQDDVVDYCRAKDILLQAYSPMGAGLIFDVPEVKELAKKYNRTIAQLCIRWCLQRGYNPLPKSATASRIKDNAEVFDFNLDEADVEFLANLKGCVGYSKDPDTAGF